MALGPLLRVMGSKVRALRWRRPVTGSAAVVRRYWQPRTRLNQNQVIAVTGCDSGLGYSLALHCKNNGARVMAGVLEEDGRAARDLAQRGVSVVHLDITDTRSIQNFGRDLSRILEDEQLEFRALINNAGVMIFGEAEWQLPEQTRIQLEVNLLGTISMTKQMLPLMRQHSSRIINITSHCALAPLPGLAVYSATKAALEAWTTALRCELNKYSVTAVTFIPGCFINESGIMANQKVHFDNMRNAMTKDTRRFYADFFDRYVEYLMCLPVTNELRQINNPELYKTFDRALLDKYPSASYKYEPWRYKFYHILFRITPMFVRDWLVEKFMMLPKWNNDNHRFSEVHQADTNAKRA